MKRIVLAVVLGYAAWTALWLDPLGAIDDALVGFLDGASPAIAATTN